MELEFEEIVYAYFDCRMGKRKTNQALAFEFALEKNLFDLYDDLIKEQIIKPPVGWNEKYYPELEQVCLLPAR